MNGTRHSLLYLNPPADCDEWSRCETGVDQACFCTCRQAIQANAKMLVPLPEWRPEGLESLLQRSQLARFCTTSNLTITIVVYASFSSVDRNFRSAIRRHLFAGFWGQIPCRTGTLFS
jgi:hypothetical protein